MERVKLHNNNLNSISIYGLQGLGKLEIISIQSNEIKTINLHSFANLPCLNKVELSSNEIQQVENKGRDGNLFSNLTDIDLSRNRITHLMADTFIQLEHLVQLNLSENELTSIHASAFKGKSTQLRPEVLTSYLS